MISTPTIMYLGFAMHKIARMDDQDYRPLRTTGKKKMPIVTRGAVRDYEEAEDNGEEDPMIAEEIEQEKPGKAEKSKTGSFKCCLRWLSVGSLFSIASLATYRFVFFSQKKNFTNTIWRCFHKIMQSALVISCLARFCAVPGLL